ncbi:helix-turn-helix domain-containing protein [Pseudomonas sp. JG-B]|uniref:helix-turn-helix domain-containing protein n=1 Tax=Pseudomonas sp. JG-B TaxID=2603214 RepID=UPI00129DBCB8|nr:helix-turn-helix transcriptional regulator [Pseudomonas sp. JG-B]MRK21545.1 helix-turn-helix transcriptional regulator [Pseudomonas sp. JG-B]
MNVQERGRFLEDLAKQLSAGTLSIGDAVIRLREDVTGMRQGMFATMCKISLRTLQQLERGESNPTVKTLNAVFQPFGMQVGIVRRPRTRDELS